MSQPLSFIGGEKVWQIAIARAVMAGCQPIRFNCEKNYVVVAGNFIIDTR